MPTWVMLIVVALLYGAAAWPLGGDLRRVAELRVEQDVSLLEQRVKLGISRRIAELRQLARGLRYAQLDNLPALRVELEDLKAQSDAFAWMALTDTEGRVLAASNGWLEGESLRGRPVYERGREVLWFGEFHPAKLLRPFLAGSEQAEVWVADVAAPVVDAEGRLRGVLVAHINAGWLRQLCDDTLGVQRQSRLGLRWSLQQSDGWSPGGETLPGLAAPAASAPGSQLLSDAQGQRWLVAQRPLLVGVQGEQPWRAIVAQDMAVALGPLNRLYLWLGGLALLTLLLGGWLAQWLMRVAARPYAGLLAAAQQRLQAAGGAQPDAELLSRLGDELVAALPLQDPRADALLRRLASNAQQLQRTLDHLPMGVALCDSAQRVVHANRGFAALLGRNADELQGQAVMELLLPAPADAARRAELTVLGEPPVPRGAAIELYTIEGGRRSVAWKRVPLFDREQRLDSVLMLLQDQSGEVSERRRADALQRRFLVLVNSALSDAFVMLGADGKVIDWSQGAVHLTGWASEVVAGRELAQLLIEPAQAGILIERARTDGQVPLATRLRRADGSDFVARGRLYQLPDGDGSLALIFRDATKDEEATQRVQESEARLAAVIGGASDAIISTDAEGHVLLFNPAAERIFGVPQAEMLGQTLDRLLPPGERGGHPGRMASFARSEVTRRPMGVGKVSGLRSDGQVLVLEAAISAARVGGRTVLTAILRDVSERDRAEQRLVEYQVQLTDLTQRLLAQEKETTRKLAQSLHDDLGQTLAAMRLMLDAGLVAAEVPAWVRRLDDVLGTANRQVREVLTELRPPLLDDQGLRAALDNELQQQQARHESMRLRLDWRADAEQRWSADVEYAAFMVAREALGNALRHARAQTIRVRVEGRDGALALRVIDDGVGDSRLAERLRPGHLGLVGMRERALAIGARLDFDSGPSQGTTVHLTWGSSNDEPALPYR